MNRIAGALRLAARTLARQQNAPLAINSLDSTGAGYLASQVRQRGCEGQ